MTQTAAATPDADRHVVKGALPSASCALLEVTEARRAQETLLMAQAQLAYSSRLEKLLETTAWTARTANQPLAAIALNAEASLRFLARPEPDAREAIDALRAIVGEVERASGMIQRIYALARNNQPDISTCDEILAGKHHNIDSDAWLSAIMEDKHAGN